MLEGLHEQVRRALTDSGASLWVSRSSHGRALAGLGGEHVIDFQTMKETFINAPPEAVFGIVGDLSRHRDIHGSGELVEVRKLTDGPTRVGTMIEADESIALGDDKMEFSAQSIVVSYDPGRSVSWIPVPPVPLRRIQWWFRVSAEGAGTRVEHEVEVDLGEEGRAMFGGTDAYNATRAQDVARGMDKTLDNLRRAVEG